MSLERLDARQLLAGDLESDLTTPTAEPGGPPMSDAAEVAPPEITADTPPTSDPGSGGLGDEFTSPDALPTDNPPADSGQDGGGEVEVIVKLELAPPGEPAPNFMAPEIVGLNYEWAGSYLTVYGWVLDDGMVGGLLVEFGGVLDGFYADTDADGYFVLTLPIQQTYGQITAVVTDWDGATSAVAWVNIV